MSLEDHIHDTFQTPPEFEFNEAAWERMEQKLAAEEDTAATATPMVFWRYLGLAALVLFPFIFVGWHYKTQIDTLQNRLQQIEAQQSEAIAQAVQAKEEELICQEIYMYDTVYQTVTLYKTVEKLTVNNPSIFTAPALATRTNFKPTWVFSNQNSSLLSDPMLLANQWSQIRQNSKVQSDLKANEVATMDRNEATIEKNTLQDVDYLSTLSTTLLDYQRKPVNMLALTADLVQSKTITDEYNPFILRLQPDGFQLSASYNWVNPLLDADAIWGRMYGVQGELHYGRHLRLLTGLEMLQLRYKLLEHSVSLPNYPIVHPDNSQDVFTYLKADMQYLQIPIGVKYVFNPDRILRPHTSIGIIARRPLHQNLAYEFLGIMHEYYVNRTFKQSAFTNNSVWGSFGLSYQYPDANWGLSVEGFYNHDFRKNDYEFEQLKYFSFKTRFFYQF